MHDIERNGRMDSKPINLRQFFDDQVPQAVQRDLLVRCILPAYSQALDECNERFLREETHDLLPHMRRAKIEQLLRGLARQHDGLTADAELNTTRNAYHTRVTCGRVTFTASTVETADTIVRQAQFRDTLARTYQLHFDFAGFRDQPPPPEQHDLLYALLIHYPDGPFSRFPSFVQVAFPSPDCLSYIDRIDLLARFRDLPELRPTGAPEPPAGEPEIRIRKLAKEQGSEA
jgi:hypothetical protein